MKFDFTYYNPTKIYFGKTALGNLSDELKNYGDRGIILSVKSGVTGLAQVSGRRNISFNERRAFDVYYVQNWTPAMDIQIIFRTIASVLGHEGAK